MEENPISVSRIFKLDRDSKVKAFADVSFSGVVVKGFSVVEGEKGLFVSMPRHQGKDGKWYDMVIPSSKEIRRQLAEAILGAYKD
ncbi:MAG: SpoVG family protein [Candidatus Omnitrophica bacterium]|jgi:stage V sporulation protein G|nr:SpoVG family protein [Candidatus Omnitrophota bacterium]MDD5078335.1 SpoVG family protein [Candidatus Omnitrophota bacterium]